LTNAPTLTDYRLWGSGQTIAIGNRSFLAPPAITNETMFQTKESWFGIVRKMTHLQDMSQPDSSGLVGGMYSFLIQRWMNHFPDVMVTRFRTPKYPGSMAYSGGEALNATFDEPNIDQSRILSSVLRFAGMPNLSHYLDLRPRDRVSINAGGGVRILKASSPSMTAAELRSFTDQRLLPDWIRSYLRDFYSDFNNDLAKLLGDDMYRTMWDY
jgi:hypothetical protein